MSGRLIGSTRASQLIGISVPTLYSFHGKRLHAKKNDLGNWVYDHDEVVAFSKWYQKTRPRFKRRFLTDGEKCGRAFSLFDAGYSVSGVVIAVDVEVERVEKWHAQWQIDQQGLERGPDLANTIERTELDTKKTKLQIAREELALKRAQRDRSERRNSRQIREEEESSSPPPDEDRPALTDVFEQAAGVKK
jgi:hypothetical protein